MLGEAAAASNVIGMRITGLFASEEYNRRFGRTTLVDRDLIRLLRDGLLEFDPHTEMLYVSAAGQSWLYEQLRSAADLC